MQSASITIDTSTGRIEQADGLFRNWTGADDIIGTPLDEFLKSDFHASITAAISDKESDSGIRYFSIKPSFPTNEFDRLVFYLPKDTDEKDGSLSFPLYPVNSASVNSTAEDLDIPVEVFDSITDFMLICSPDFTIRKVNTAADSVFGAGDSLEGRKCYQALRGKDNPCEDCPLPQTLDSRKITPLEYYDADIAEFMELRTYPQVDEHDYFKGFTLINRVVSHRREQESETTQSKKLQALGRMATGIAHDFNNMLTIILGRVQLLKPKLADTNMLTNLKTIEKAALDSTEIIQRLQDFTRKRERSVAETFSPVSLNPLVEDAVNYARTRTERIKKQRGIHVEIETQLEDIPLIEGNQASLRNALLNLLYNAIDAMDVGGLITIWTDTIGSTVEIGVSDTGIGMSREVMEKIFDPFFTTKGEKGNGLGLSEVYGIINQHNAKIDVDSTPGEGTTFIIHFSALDSSGRIG